jgi:3-oxoacyl-[acyl-carrier protein] reductase|tara:strand:- start:365 stop:1105 length:741 start_codon:yes stop_codon:yes gene_type:complete
MLKNKLALITGANRGIGLSILRKFSENGANIIACARKKSSQFENDIINISNEYKNKITPFYFDLLNKDEIEKGIKEIFSLSDNIEILVNNAGINQVALFQMTPIKKIKEIFEINFFSHLFLTQKLMKIMIKNKKGTIINVASNAALECDLGRTGYASSKAALIAFTKVLSKELGSFNIRVNAVAPGITKTDMLNKDVSRKIIDEAIERVPLKRAAEPDEISDVILFLASDMSRYVSGEVVFATGGY